MARYTRIFSSIWDDEDFCALRAGPQRLYVLLVTQPNISHCGVLTLSERRWSRLAPDTDADSVRADLDDLQRAKFIVVDEDTEELLARTYMKWAEFYRVPNGAKACWKAIDQVVSKPLRTVCGTVLGTLTGTLPETVGPPLQQASKQPAAINQQPAAPLKSRDNCAHHPADDAAAFDLALDLAVEHRRSLTPKITNPGRWTTVTRQGIIDDHSSRIHELLAAGHTPEGVVDVIYKRSTSIPLRDIEADHARSAAAGHLLVEQDPYIAYRTAMESYPDQHDAIVAEITARVPGWPVPAQQSATVTAIRGPQ